MVDILDFKKSFWNSWNDIKIQSRDRSLTSWQILDSITSLVDEAIIKLVEKHESYAKGIAVLALGGYARRQMSPQSDIDLLILHKGRLKSKQKEFINLFTTDLWDMGTNPGIQIKDVKDVARAALEDEVVRTSFIDNRFLAGTEKIYDAFLTVMNDRIAEKGVNEFLLMKIDGVRNRSKKFRDSIYRLEPNIKESNGGVRDINTIYWICKILYKTDNLTELIKHKMLTVDEYDELMLHSEFIYRVRNELHYCHGRKYDVLNMEAQREVAENLGYSNTASALGVESFMRNYYITAKTIAEITEKVINRALSEMTMRKFNTGRTYKVDIGEGFLQYANKLTLKNKSVFEEKPKRLISVFLYAAAKGLKISDSTFDTIRENLYLIDGTYIKEHGKLFLKAISRFPQAGEICTRMAKAGVLQAMIPEFEEIVCKPQFDYYHHYTVDEHTFLALTYIDKLSSSLPPHLSPYQKVISELGRKDLLALSILLHDIGKGQGKNHSIVGMRMSRIICRRLGMSMDDTDTVANMVLHHLLMSMISQRRDLHDIEVINYFTSFINNEDELRILFLLTYADMNAVGGETFNKWRNSLLTELYAKGMHGLANEDIEKEFEKIVLRKREKIADRLEKEPHLQEVAAGLDDEFLYSNAVGHIVRYIHQAERVSDDNPIEVELEHRNDLRGIEITLCTRDFAGVLRRMAGALSSLGLNILWAQIYTLPNGIAIDTLMVDNPWNSTDNVEEKEKNMIKRVMDAVAGNIDIHETLKSKSSYAVPKTSPSFSKKDKVVFDNEMSHQYTILDIFTQDRLGLLYIILGVFRRLGLNLIKAKISTDVDRVVDSFYLTDMNGEKITDERTLEAIRDELIQELESSPV
ncbi:[protein-PII] uridylyltransferase [Limisalsivibrio acetivorans]|uniref:[protein-PII] uridylyltransferase n=1 Tax=Limisalsivibrio acetivorans TaxID=1304888 RepID=UPI0003B3E535|nr:[protein-PII] uridylyltransferase [Limisalsivibrio acetivorans]